MDLDDTLVALADETRRDILQRLSAGDARVTEIAAPYDISLNSVSKHIRILERAGLKNAWAGGGNAWGIVNATIDQFAGLSDAAVLIIGPVPLSIRARLENGDRNGLLGQLPAFEAGHQKDSERQPSRVPG